MWRALLVRQPYGTGSEERSIPHRVNAAQNRITKMTLQNVAYYRHKFKLRQGNFRNHYFRTHCTEKSVLLQKRALRCAVKMRPCLISDPVKSQIKTGTSQANESSELLIPSDTSTCILVYSVTILSQDFWPPCMWQLVPETRSFSTLPIKTRGARELGSFEKGNHAQEPSARYSALVEGHTLCSIIIALLKSQKRIRPIHKP